MRIRFIFVLLLTLGLAPALAAQCADCCKNSPAEPAAKTATAGAAEHKLPLLFNSQCPVTGKPTTADSPTIAYQSFRISLCCNGCRPLFAKLPKAKKTTFVAALTGENRRSAFPKSEATVTTVAKDGKGPCCETAPNAKSDCCEEKAKATTAAKPDCCQEKAKAATVAKPDCCQEKAKATTTAKPDCCQEKAKAAAKDKGTATKKSH